VASTMVNSTIASQVRLACRVVALSAMLPMVSTLPRIARQLASLDGASRDAWIAAQLLRQRPLWTAALVSLPALPILAWRLLPWVHAVLMSRLHCLILQLWVLQAPSAV